MAINSTSFLPVLTGPSHTVAVTDSYLYANKYNSALTQHTIYRSADGVDWESTATTVSGSCSLVEGTSRIVLTGATTKSMAKNGTTWSDATGITGTTTGGRFIGGKYFVWTTTNYFYSDDGMAWTAGSPARVTQDVGYDGTSYLILTTDRVYKSTDLVSFVSYPLPSGLNGISIYYAFGQYWISILSGSWRILVSNTLDDFTTRWSSSAVPYFQMVDNALFFYFGNVSLPQDKGLYVYTPALGSPVLVTLEDSEAGVTGPYIGPPLSRQVVIKGSYVYHATGESVVRAVYNTGWNAITGVLAALERGDVIQLAGTVQSATGVIQGTLRLDTSTGAFAARTVYLYSYTTGAKLAETTSDGTTGAWSFTQLAPGEYFVVGVAAGADLAVPRDFDALGVITVV